MDRGDSVRRDSLKWPILISILWLAVAVAVIGSRYSEFWDLPLNAMGDLLAGVFAPLAFFWLFIATSLQRRELGLQRQELADTRKVLDEQRKELERSVQESNHQTSIMQKTLEATQTRDIYDDFRLRLYYLASYINDYRTQRALMTATRVDTNNVRFDAHRLFQGHVQPVSMNDPTSVDTFFKNTQKVLGIDFSINHRHLKRDEDGLAANNQLLFYITRITRDLKALLDEHNYQRVPTIAATTDALDLTVLLQRLESIRSELAEALFPIKNRDK